MYLFIDRDRYRDLKIQIDRELQIEIDRDLQIEIDRDLQIEIYRKIQICIGCSARVRASRRGEWTPTPRTAPRPTTTLTTQTTSTTSRETIIEIS